MNKNEIWEAYGNAFPESTENAPRRRMSLIEYQARAMSTRTDPCNNLSYMAFGLLAEAGEVADKIAKAIRKEHITINRDSIGIGRNANAEEFAEVITGLKNEVGDVLWFCAGLADIVGVSLQDIAEANLAKLAERAKTNTIIDHTDH